MKKLVSEGKEEPTKISLQPLHENRILTPLQSGFMPRDFSINQHITFLYNSFFQALDSGKKVRVVFCDVSKAFGRVWHQGLLCKPSATGGFGRWLSRIRSCLSTRRQRVILSGSHSD